MRNPTIQENGRMDGPIVTWMLWAKEEAKEESNATVAKDLGTTKEIVPKELATREEKAAGALAQVEKGLVKETSQKVEKDMVSRDMEIHTAREQEAKHRGTIILEEKDTREFVGGATKWDTNRVSALWE